MTFHLTILARPVCSLRRCEMIRCTTSPKRVTNARRKVLRSLTLVKLL